MLAKLNPKNLYNSYRLINSSFKKSLLNKITLSNFQGFLLGIPYAFDNSPIYFFALLVFFIATLRRPFTFLKLRTLKVQLIYLLILVALLSNLIGSSSKSIDSFRILSTSFFFLLLFFGEMVESKRELLKGFSSAMLIWAVLLIFLAFYFQIYKYGLLLFSVPEYRLWGAGFVPDWPNYMAFMLAFALMLNIFVFKRVLPTFILFIAIVITTSRTPFLAVGLILSYYIFYPPRVSNLKKIILCTFICFSIAFTVIFATDFSPDFIDRLLLFEDRQQIYTFAFELLSNSPIFGQGSILLDDSVGFDGFPSFHNTYFDISVRHGLPAMLLFLYILIPSKKNFKLGGAAFILTILFFILGAFFQNFLKHPHIIMLYMVLINSGYIFLNYDSKN